MRLRRNLWLAVATTAAVTLTTVPVSGAALAAKKSQAARDTDRDGMPDAYEKANGLNTRKNDARADKDRDKLPNLAEFKAGTNPSRSDTDGDGVRDGDDKRPKIKDPVRQARAVVTSFDTGTGSLTLTYPKGPVVTVTVTGETEFSWHRRGCAAPATVADLKPGAGVHKVDVKRAGPEAGDDEPGHHEPGHHEPGHHEPGHHEPGHHGPGHHGPGHHEAGDDEPGRDQPMADSATTRPGGVQLVAEEISLICGA
ncbi:hypothetical protein [Actinoplanes sp. M2I2]|uniref:hypothetical protein n=1 Tax=Actinoplanes sp. M2I2 TaxID=1734444 RepID=UPI0020202238|nr:hypothetical protein [Actinoplanes sp. M2I2]